MKRIIIVFAALMIICSLITATADDYSPFDMTMEDFCIKYNAQPAPLGTTVAALDEPAGWLKNGESDVAVFYADSTLNDELMIAFYFDENKSKSKDINFYAIQIGFKPDQFAGGVAIANRCLDLFEDTLFSINAGAHAIGQVIANYYLNHYENKDMVSFWQFQDGITCAFLDGEDGYFYLNIYNAE